MHIIIVISMALDVVSESTTLTIPTAMYVTVYLGCAISAACAVDGFHRAWVADSPPASGLCDTATNCRVESIQVEMHVDSAGV